MQLFDIFKFGDDAFLYDVKIKFGQTDWFTIALIEISAILLLILWRFMIVEEPARETTEKTPLQVSTLVASPSPSPVKASPKKTPVSSPVRTAESPATKTATTPVSSPVRAVESPAAKAVTTTPQRSPSPVKIAPSDASSPAPLRNKSPGPKRRAPTPSKNPDTPGERKSSRIRAKQN